MSQSSPFLPSRAKTPLLTRQDPPMNSFSFGSSLFSESVWPADSADIVDIDTDIAGIIGTLDCLGLNDENQRNSIIDSQNSFKSFGSYSNPSSFARPNSVPPHFNYKDEMPSKSVTPKQLDEIEPGTKSIWVGNIPSSTTQTELDKIFSVFGHVDSVKILPHKNCGFVNFSILAEAINAKKSMNGKLINGVMVKTGYAKAPSVSQQSTPVLFDRDVSGDRSDSFSSMNSSNHIMNIAPPVWTNVGSPSMVQMPSPRMGSFNNVASSALNMSSPRMTNLSTPVTNIASPRMNSNPLNLNLTPILNTSSPRLNPLNLNFMPMNFAPSPQRNAFASPAAPHLMSESNIRPLYEPPSLKIKSLDQVSNLMALAGVPSAQNPARQTPVLTEPVLILQDKYATSIPPLPELNRPKFDQNRLRDIRKKLEGHCTIKEINSIFEECIDVAVELSTDYIGNVVIQKIVEKGDDAIKLAVTQKIAPHFAAIGIHKNGTWVVQKVIDTAKSTAQLECIVQAVTPFSPPLFLDQFGNYVVQCCLRLGAAHNQFIFDACSTKCWEIGQGRFGARSMRASLESQFATKRQQKHVAIAIVNHGVKLAMNQNGSILITWLLDTSDLPGRYRVLAPKITKSIVEMSCHKIGSGTILKLVNQRVELDARDITMTDIFFGKDHTLQAILSDFSVGVTVVQKILASGCVSIEEKINVADVVRSTLSKMHQQLRDNTNGYKKLLDELAMIPSELRVIETLPVETEIVSPLSADAHFFSSPVSSPRSIPKTFQNTAKSLHMPSPLNSHGLPPTGDNYTIQQHLQHLQMLCMDPNSTNHAQIQSSLDTLQRNLDGDQQYGYTSSPHRKRQ